MSNLTDTQLMYLRTMQRKLKLLKTFKFSYIKDNITPFITQFKSEEEQFVGYKLIDLLNYYNNDSLVIYVKYILNELRRRVYVNLIKQNPHVTDEEYEEEWSHYINQTVFVPLSDKGIVDGAYPVVYKFKELSEFGIDEDNNISSIENIVQHIKRGKKNIFIIDDFVGHGFQILEKFLPRKFNFLDYGNCALKELFVDFKDINFEFFVLTSTEKGRDAISTKYNFSYIDLYTNDNNIFEYNTKDWNNEDELKMFKRVVDNIVKNHALYFDHTLNLAILFDHSSPKPTHPIYWNQNEITGWKALRRRK